jgi:hypothetical protein
VRERPERMDALVQSGGRHVERRIEDADGEGYYVAALRKS